MRVIAHLSDLHFGRVDPATLPALQAALIAARPDVLVVSGDLTQRARRHEFEATRRFLDRLPFPRVVVPGNHDIPLFNLIARATAPFRSYRSGFANELEPLFIDREIAVLGINTARASTFKNGRINMLQVERSCARLEQCGPAVTRIVVTHHPFDITAAGNNSDVIGRAGLAMAAFPRSRVDLILSGHLHVCHAAPSAVRYGDAGWAPLLVQAGTATSTRRRGEVNAFNLIRINRPEIAVESVGWAGEVFRSTATARFLRGSEGWINASTGLSARGPAPCGGRRI